MASQIQSVPATGQAGRPSATQKYYQRFDRIDRVMHAFLMTTFIGCAITGIPPLFSSHEWAAGLARALAKLLPRYPDIKVEVSVDYGLTDIVAHDYEDVGLLLLLWCRRRRHQ